MGDSIITILAIFLAAILMFIFPLMSLSERTDDVTQLAIQEATTRFVDNVRNTGKITLADYQRYIETINSSGCVFSPEILIGVLDENPGVKVTQAEMTKIGENVYYNEYTSQIERDLFDKNNNNEKKLKEGDIISVTVRNTNRTISQLLVNFFYRVVGKEVGKIEVTYGGIVSVNGSNY